MVVVNLFKMILTSLRIYSVIKRNHLKFLTKIEFQIYRYIGKNFLPANNPQLTMKEKNKTQTNQWWVRMQTTINNKRTIEDYHCILVALRITKDKILINSGDNGIRLLMIIQSKTRLGQAYKKEKNLIKWLLFLLM